MFQKVSKVILLSLIVSLLPPNIQVANSNEILWNPGISNGLYDAGSGLVPGAKIRNTGLLIYKSNPDELIMKIIMSDSFEDKPFSGKGRNMAMWIYWPLDYCWNESRGANCEGLFTIGVPNFPTNYPTAKSNEYILAYSHNKAANIDRKATTCKAPWWIEGTNKPRDTWAFAISITCLKIPKTFGWYAYSSIDLGQTDIATDFSLIQTITYPFHELAAKSAQSSNSSGGTQEEAIASFSKIVSDATKRGKQLKTLVTKSKVLTKSKKASHLKTIKEFENYAKMANVQILELKNKGVNFEIVLQSYIEEWLDWNQKLINISSSLSK